MKTILTDIDGVMVSWIDTFEKFMEYSGFKPIEGAECLYSISERYGIPPQKSKELTRIFNKSAYITILKPILGSVDAVRFLFEEHGVQFIGISALPDHPETRKYRWKNLRDLFGRAFIDLILTDTAEAKKEHLQTLSYKPRVWVEDLGESAVMGADMGLQSILMDHPYNRHVDDPRVFRAKDWGEAIPKILSIIE